MATRKTSTIKNPLPAGLTPGPGAAMVAVGDVIARRMEILNDAMANPGKADLRELALMSSEKVEAFSASAAVVTRDAGKLSADLGQAAGEEAALAARALSDMGRSASPLAMATIQADYMMGLWSRAAGRGIALSTAVAGTQAAAWAPIGAAAVANAKRLKR